MTEQFPASTGDRVHDTSDQQLPPEQEVGLVTSRAQQMLDERAIEPTLQEDGSQIRRMKTEEIASRFASPELIETTHPEGSQSYEFSYKIPGGQERDDQVVAWQEGDEEFAHSVRSILTDGEPQFVRNVPASTGKQIDTMMNLLERGYDNDRILQARYQQARAEKAAGGGRFKKAKSAISRVALRRKNY